MLVLSRFVNERIRIGDHVEIVVVGVRDGRVRLGIDAPKEVPVDRHEVRQRKNADATAKGVTA